MLADPDRAQANPLGGECNPESVTDTVASS